MGRKKKGFLQGLHRLSENLHLQQREKDAGKYHLPHFRQSSGSRTEQGCKGWTD